MIEQKAIPPFIPTITAPLLGVIKAEFVSKVEDEDLRVLLSDTLDAVQATAVVLADGDANDSAQVKRVWLGLINVSGAAFADAELTQAINKISNPTVRKPLLTLKSPIVAMVKALTDEVDDNGTQIETVWREFIKDRAVQDVFFGLIDDIINANLEGSAKTIAQVLWGSLKEVIRGELIKRV